MKVQVSMKLQAACQAVAAASAAPFDFVLGPHDTIASVKERIAMVEPIAFPDPVIFLNGKPLSDNQRVADCGVKEGDVLELVVQACEKAFTQQLDGLLQARALTPNELGLLYCHQHGVPMAEVLAALGYDDGLQQFLMRSKELGVENGCVVVRRKDSETKVQEPVHGRLVGIPEEAAPERAARRIAVTVTVTLKTTALVEPEEIEVTLNDLDTVATAKEQIAAAAMVPFASGELLLDGQMLEDAKRLDEYGVKAGSSLNFVVEPSEDAFVEQLSEILQDRKLSCNELGLLYNCRHGVSVPRVLKLLGAGKDFTKFLTRQWAFVVESGFTRLDASSPEDQRFTALLRAMGPSDAAGAQALDAVIRALADAIFLNVARVVRTGSAINDTAVKGSATGDLVVVINGLPKSGEDSLLGGLLSSIAGALNSKDDIVEAASVVDGAVLVKLTGVASDVHIRVSPSFDTVEEAVAALAPLGPQARYSPFLLERRAQFVSALPGPVKATVRLLKWWREQQQWRSAASKPSDELLETLVAFAALGGRPAGQHACVREVMALLAHIDQLEILWPAAQCKYSIEDVPETILAQRPLILDPVNPYVNLAAPQVFDCAELQHRARSGIDLFQQ